MKARNRIIIVAFSVVLVFSLVAPLSWAGTESTTTGKFNLGNTAPTVNAVEIYSNSGLTSVAGSVTPQQEYWIKVTVSDGNTISDVVGIKLQFFYNAASSGSETAPAAPGDSETSVIINWTKGGGATAIIDPPYGLPTSTWTIGTPIMPSVLTTPSGDWVFPIVVGKVATQTTPSPAVGQWDLYAQTTDAANATGELYHRGKAMYWYGEIGVGDPYINFGDVVAGSDFLTNVYTGTNSYAICNGSFQVQVKSDASWTGSQGVQVATLDSTGATASPNQFALKMQVQFIYGSAVLVSASPQPIMNGVITGESGFVDNYYGWWLRLSALFTKETYSGAITYSINN